MSGIPILTVLCRKTASNADTGVYQVLLPKARDASARLRGLKVLSAISF